MLSIQVPKTTRSLRTQAKRAEACEVVLSYGHRPFGITSLHITHGSYELPALLPPRLVVRRSPCGGRSILLLLILNSLEACRGLASGLLPREGRSCHSAQLRALAPERNPSLLRLRLSSGSSGLRPCTFGMLAPKVPKGAYRGWWIPGSPSSFRPAACTRTR